MSSGWVGYSVFGRVATVLYVQRTNLSVMMQLECFSILQRRLRNGVRRLTSLIAFPLRGALDILAPQATYSFTGLGCGLVLITHISQTMELHCEFIALTFNLFFGALMITHWNRSSYLGLFLCQVASPLWRESPRTGCKTPDLASSSPGVTVIACVFWVWARDCSSRVDKSSLG